MNKQEAKALTTSNGYRFYMVDDTHVYFCSKRPQGYADIKMSHAAASDDCERLSRMNKDLTE